MKECLRKRGLDVRQALLLFYCSSFLGMMRAKPVVMGGGDSMINKYIFNDLYFIFSDYLFKLLLIGDSGVGKSCLLLRFAVSIKLNLFKNVYSVYVRLLV